MITRPRSDALRKRIAEVVPGGIDGNAKVFPGSVPVIERAEGCRLIDVDGNIYLDYCAGYGPLIFGHMYGKLNSALRQQLDIGMLYGLPHELMYRAASLVCELVPCAELVRFTNSGTEATLNSIRIARGITKRNRIVKFYGAYHGTHESVLVSTKIVNPNPVFPTGEPNSAGIPGCILDDTYVLPFNDSQMVGELISQRAEEIAAVIVEPVLGSHGIVAEKAFLENLRGITEDNGILLIFDEVITGFRLAPGGAQEIFGVVPDLVALGKTMGGGFPIAAFAGKARFMESIIPTGDVRHDAGNVVYHSGTYNSNPLGLTAVVASLEELRHGKIQRQINTAGDRLREGIIDLMRQYSVPGTVAGLGSIVQIYFGITEKPKTLSDTLGVDRQRAAWFHRSLLDRGVFFIAAPRGFVSSAHESEDIQRTLEVVEDTFHGMIGKA
jgi:glutamate-1-semialdehyde 2,1-aminomutase